MHCQALSLGGFFVYIVAGMVVNYKKYDKTGVDSIPQRAFWASLPGLAKDGCTFTYYTIRRKAAPGGVASVSRVRTAAVGGVGGVDAAPVCVLCVLCTHAPGPRPVNALLPRPRPTCIRCWLYGCERLSIVLA